MMWRWRFRGGALHALTVETCSDPDVRLIAWRDPDGIAMAWRGQDVPEEALGRAQAYRLVGVQEDMSEAFYVLGDVTPDEGAVEETLADPLA